MKKNEIEILSGQVKGTRISMEYYNNLDGLNYSVEDDDEPHPDLKKALVAMHVDLATAHYVIGEEREKFRPLEFEITKAGDGEDTTDQIVIKGKLETYHGKLLTINSGEIPMDNDTLREKVETLREELWGYFFNEKNASGIHKQTTMEL